MPAKPTYHVTLPFEVRDYECDLQGIVNNAVYQHYLEHARHTLLKQSGMTFAQLNKAGVQLVVIRAEIDYKAPLRSGDKFIVASQLIRVSRVRFGFRQDIYRQDARGETLVLQAVIHCAAMDPKGKPIMPTALEPLFRSLKVAEPDAFD